jgi:hypothetical protein
MQLNKYSCQFAVLLATLSMGCKPDSGKLIVTNGCEASMDPQRLRREIPAAVVQIVTPTGTGSGFVVESTPKDLLVATNLHVVENDESFTVDIKAEREGNLSLGGGKIVKVDAANDLALLRLPASQITLKTLPLTEEAPTLGEPVCVFGFPGVAASAAEMTMERGDVTSTKRTFEGSQESPTFVQTNANVNPGNSGGPVVNSCGSVMGVASAIATQTQRTALFVPATHLVKLVTTYEAGPPDPKLAIRGRLDEFIRRLRFHERVQAGKFVARSFLSEVRPAYDKALDLAVAAAMPRIAVLQEERQVPFEQWPVEEKFTAIDSALAEYELLQYTFRLKLAQEAGMVNEFAKLRHFVVPMLEEMIGAIEDCTTESIEVRENAADAYLKCTLADKEVRRARFAMVFEWGDWVIADISFA